MPPLLADFTHARPCKPFCEKYLTLPHDLGQKREILRPNQREGAFKTAAADHQQSAAVCIT